MCEPATIAAAAIAAVSALAQAKAQNDSVKAQNVFEQNRFEQAKTNAEANFFAQAAQANLRIQQEAEATSDQIQETNRQKAQARAQAVVSAGEAGVSGLSVDALLADFERSAARNNETARRNLEFIQQQTEQDVKGLQAAAANQQIAVLPNIRGGQPGLVTALKVGSAAYGAAADAGAFKSTPSSTSMPSARVRTAANSRAGAGGANYRR